MITRLWTHAAEKRDKDLWIFNRSFSCFPAAEKVFSNASLMMIMTIPMHYSIFFNQSSKVSPHKSRRNRHNPVTLDTKIGKDLVLLVLPCLALTGKYIMESIQWDGFLCQDGQSEYRETSTLAHTSQVTLCSQFTRCVTELVLIHTRTQFNPLRV